MESLTATIDARHKEYGDYTLQATVAQNIKRAILAHATAALTSQQRESLEMIATKISRIITGNPHNYDSWHDIAGYAQLIADQIQPRKNEPCPPASHTLCSPW